MSSLGLSTDFVKKLSSSRFNYWAGYVVNLSLVGWLISRGFQANAAGVKMSGLDWALCAAMGFVVWTLAEYILHRYLYHEIPSALAVGHDLHHVEPRALLGVPWYITTIALIGVYYLIAMAASPARTGAVMAFTWLGYIGYCAIHHSTHHYNFKNAWFQKVRKHHLIHHARHDTNWGITTDLWDRIFRTKFSKLP